VQFVGPQSLVATPEEWDVALVAKGGALKFFELAWAHTEQKQFKLSLNWHHELICKAWEAFLRGDEEAEKVAVNIPPGSTKSLLVSVFLPCYAWGPGKRGNLRLGFGSFDVQLSLRDSNACKSLMRSDWYQRRWGFAADPHMQKRWGIVPVTAGDQNAVQSDSASVWYTSAGGLRFATSTGSKATGWHFHWFGVDDPTKPKTIENGGDQARDELKKTSEWWSGTIASRRVNPNFFGRWVVMQRLHTEDLAGEVLKEGYTPIVVPAEHDPERPCLTPWGDDPRTEPGQSFWPERFGPRALADLRKSLKGHATAQLQQNPIPDGGAIFKPKWFEQRYRVLPARMDHWWQSWDMTFSGKATSDYVCGQVWAAKGSDRYLVHQVRARMGLPATIQAVLSTSEKFPQATRKLVEAKANGPAVVQVLESKLPGLVLVEPQGGKVARAHEASVYFEAGNVWLPEEAEWLHDYVQEFLAFPQGANDDQVDTTTQALNKFTPSMGDRYDRLSKALRGG